MMSSMPAPARIAQITRYPVKSLQGEDLTQVEVERDGLRGDRHWGIRDVATGKILTARRAPKLLHASATLDDTTPVIELPTGRRCVGPGPDTDAAMSQWLDRPVQLVHSVGAPRGSAEYFEDATDDSSEAIAFTLPADRFVDASPLLVLTTASLRAGSARYPAGDWQARRFRPNLLVDISGDDFVEDGWIGSCALRIGDVRLLPDELCARCTMVTRPQPGIDEDRDIFRTLARQHGGLFGAWTTIAQGGSIRVGNEVSVEPLLTT